MGQKLFEEESAVVATVPNVLEEGLDSIMVAVLQEEHPQERGDELAHRAHRLPGVRDGAEAGAAGLPDLLRQQDEALVLGLVT